MWAGNFICPLRSALSCQSDAVVRRWGLDRGCRWDFASVFTEVTTFVALICDGRKKGLWIYVRNSSSLGIQIKNRG